MIAWFAKLPLVGKIGVSVLAIILPGFVLVLGYYALKRILGKYLEWQNVQTLEIKERVGLKIEFIKTAASILGGFFFLATLYFTWQNLIVAQEKITTDLFTKAVEQLGSDKLEVRLGSIYSLERIAKESMKDHWPIMEILTTYIRNRAPWPPNKQTISESKERKVLISKLPKPYVAYPLPPPSVYKPNIDVQAALTVIGRRKYKYGNGEDKRLDLRQTDLQGADLYEAHLEGANFTEANLEEARLLYAHLENAIFDGAQITYANLANVHLDGALLRGANLNGSVMMGAKMKDADLSGAELKGILSFGAHLEKAILMGANFENSVFIGTHFEGAIFSYSNLIDNTKIVGAHFEGADLRRADLRGAIDLTQQQISNAIIDEDTKLPENLIKSIPKKSNSN